MNLLDSWPYDRNKGSGLENAGIGSSWRLSRASKIVGPLTAVNGHGMSSAGSFRMTLRGRRDPEPAQADSPKGSTEVAQLSFHK